MATEPQEDHHLAMSHGCQYKKHGGVRVLASLSLKAISEETTWSFELNFCVHRYESKLYSHEGHEIKNLPHCNWWIKARHHLLDFNRTPLLQVMGSEEGQLMVSGPDHLLTMW